MNYECSGCRLLFKDKEQLTMVRINRLEEDIRYTQPIWKPRTEALCKDCLRMRVYEEQ